MKKNILIVEDEEQIVAHIKNRLDSNLYNISVALDGRDALSQIYAKSFDLITLDVMLPHIDGFEITKAIRKKSYQTLIIMVSALDTEEFKTQGYDYGVDDYIAKPFSAKELSIKIKSLLKRREELNSQVSHKISNVLLNEQTKEIHINGFQIDFTPSEYLIFTLLLKNKNRVFTRQELSQLIYDNYLGEIDERGIDSHVYHIRKKVKLFDERELLKTVRGTGYRIYEN